MSPRWLVVSILALARCGGPAFEEGATSAADGGAVDAQGDDGAAGPSVLAADVDAGARAPVDAGGDVEAGVDGRGEGGACTMQTGCMGSSAGAVCEPPWRPCVLATACAFGEICCEACR